MSYLIPCGQSIKRNLQSLVFISIFSASDSPSHISIVSTKSTRIHQRPVFNMKFTLSALSAITYLLLAGTITASPVSEADALDARAPSAAAPATLSPSRTNATSQPHASTSGATRAPTAPTIAPAALVTRPPTSALIRRRSGDCLGRAKRGESL